MLGLKFSWYVHRKAGNKPHCSGESLVWVMVGGQGPTQLASFLFPCFLHFFLLPVPEQLSTFSPGENALYIIF